MSVPAELQYTPEHEWVAIDGGTATIGITDYATQALGDVVFVSLPAVGAAVTSGEPCGEVESTKSVSDLYSPVDGEVVEINEELDDDPGLINAEPYGLGWMFRVRVADGQATGTGLLSPTEYDALTKSAQLSPGGTTPPDARPMAKTAIVSGAHPALLPGGTTPRTPRCPCGRA